MVPYITRRLLLTIPALLLVSLGIFSLLRLAPGDTVMAMIAESGLVPKENLDAIREQLGLNDPFFVQYFKWLSNVVRLDLGTSLVTKQTVLSQILKAVPTTFQLALMALSISVVIAIPLGVISALKHNSPVDHVARVMSVVGIAAPDFWIGTIAILFLSLVLGYLPPATFVPFFDDPVTNLEKMWLPALILGVRLSAITTRMTRSMMLDVLHQDFVRTARAKGLKPSRILIGHSLKNAIVPVIAVVGNQFSQLMAGAVVMETLFSLPGVGQLTLISVQRRDYTQVQGNVMAMALLVITVNIVVDLVYAWLDPRIRYK